MASFTKQDALNYHSEGRAGKIEVVPTKPYSTQYDLSLAYSPGVAEPCREIEKDADLVYKYTAKKNLVAVMSNGTAVLGLGDIGTLAGKPVMEGKGLLFKVFADVDVFDIEIDKKDPKEFIEVAKSIAPTFGGINLEDIKAPECFEIEETLKKILDIPVFHDDQHGTAIISAAGLLNALELVGKNIEDIKLVVNGAGASGISCTKLYNDLGVRIENIFMLDSKGLVTTKRKDLNKYKQQFAQNSDMKILEEVINGADVFLGLSKANILTRKMVRTMAVDPIIFAMANPDPEISYEEAMSSRDDLIFATGRSDYPNQVNNVLGFPFIFRGALDVMATCINQEMKIAAAYALAELAKEEVPEKVNAAYKSKNLVFGRDYIIPKPLDPRLITSVTPAVAKAAIDTGVARKTIKDWDEYKIELMKRLGLHNKLINDVRVKAKQEPKKILFADGENYKVQKAVQAVKKSGIGQPVLLGNTEKIIEVALKNNLSLSDIHIVDYRGKEEQEKRELFAERFFRLRQRKGVTLESALKLMYEPNYFGVMMVEQGEVDGFLAGFSSNYTETIRPALQILGPNNSLGHIAGMYIVQTKRGPFFFADSTVNIQPEAKVLIDTTLLAANEVRKFNVEPVIAMVSYSNYGNIKIGSPSRVHEAVELLHKNYPDLLVDGEMQANYAFNRALRDRVFPFSKLYNKDVNTIIFPNLSSGNIAYKMMHELADSEIVGPILLGIRKPVHVLQMESSVRQIINMASIAVVDAQTSSDEMLEL